MKMEDEVREVQTAFLLNSLFVGMMLGGMSRGMRAQVFVFAVIGNKHYLVSKPQLENKLRKFMTKLDHPDECSPDPGFTRDVYAFFRANVKQKTHDLDDEKPGHECWLEAKPSDVNIEYYLKALGLWGVLM